MIDLSGATILLTGGTGSFGKAFTGYVMDQHPGATVRVFSRDELKQADMALQLADHVALNRLRFLVGDVRDRRRMTRAAQGCDYIIHAAAMKQVPACEYNPFEAVLTNVIGAQHVVDAAIDSGVAKVVAVSTDKAVNPVNLYGATKLCAEKIIVQGNAYAAQFETRLACVRYGNVIASRGSVIPLFRQQQDHGALRITDPRMTRFWIPMRRAIELVIYALDNMAGGEVFVPKLQRLKVTDLASAMAPNIPTEVVGVRAGEKLHEALLTTDEARHTVEVDDVYVILPEGPLWANDDRWEKGIPLPDGFVYSSNGGSEKLAPDEIMSLIDDAVSDLAE